MRRIAAVAAVVIVAACGDPSTVQQSPAAGGPAPTVVVGTTTAVATTIATTTTSSTSTTTTTTTTSTVPPTTTVSIAPTSAPASGDLLALDVLSLIAVQNEHRGGYVRELFGYPADLDGDGCDTRADVLRAESLTPAQIDPFGCTVVAGDWVSVYDGVTVTNPGELEIDHVVALKEAWDSGAWEWSPTALLAFANDLSDPRGLRAVTVATNRAKGDKDPSNWLPPDPADECPFIGDWVAIKARWGLSMDQSEFGRIRNLLNGPCAGWRIAPLEPTDVPTQPVPTSPVPFVSVPSTATPSTEVYYKNCTAARAAGAAPLHVGEPGYRTALDGDKDGVACE